MKTLDRRAEANLFSGLMFPADIGRRSRVVTNLDDGDSWRALVGMALDGTFQLLADDARVGAAIDQSGRHRLSLLRQIADLDGSGDLDREGVQVGKGRTFANAHGHLGDLRML